MKTGELEIKQNIAVLKQGTPFQKETDVLDNDAAAIATTAGAVNNNSAISLMASWHLT